YDAAACREGKTESACGNYGGSWIWPIERRAGRNQTKRFGKGNDRGKNKRRFHLRTRAAGDAEPNAKPSPKPGSKQRSADGANSSPGSETTGRVCRSGRRVGNVGAECSDARNSGEKDGRTGSASGAHGRRGSGRSRSARGSEQGRGGRRSLTGYGGKSIVLCCQRAKSRRRQERGFAEIEGTDGRCTCTSDG